VYKELQLFVGEQTAEGDEVAGITIIMRIIIAYAFQQNTFAHLRVLLGWNAQTRGGRGSE
jgi:hypothetical protein